MARCRCGALDACGCIVAGGDGAFVTGSGSASDPYIVSAPPRATGTLQVFDTPSVDLVLTGKGLQGDPFLLTANVLLANVLHVLDTETLDLTVDTSVAGEVTLSGQVHTGATWFTVDTPDIVWTRTGAGSVDDPMFLSGDVPWFDASAPGNTGDVMTRQADGTYAPGPPVTAPIGTINTGVGLSGDGSGGNALRVNICTYDDLRAVCGPP